MKALLDLFKQVTQNEEFDFLLDEAGTIPRPGDGEIYVPVGYQQDFGLVAGDRLGIRTEAGARDFVDPRGSGKIS